MVGQVETWGRKGGFALAEPPSLFVGGVIIFMSGHFEERSTIKTDGVIFEFEKPSFRWLIEIEVTFTSNVWLHIIGIWYSACGQLLD